MAEHVFSGRGTLQTCCVCQTLKGGGAHLRAGEDDWFAQVLTHEGEGRGRVRHGVCAVQDHEAVVGFIVSLGEDKQPGSVGDLRWQHQHAGLNCAQLL